MQNKSVKPVLVVVFFLIFLSSMALFSLSAFLPQVSAQIFTPQILAFDDEYAVKDMLRDIEYPSWYPTFKLEDGCMRMNLRPANTEKEDGFVINVHDYLNGIEISDYKYLQFKIKRENCANAKLTLQINTVAGVVSKEFYINPNNDNDGHWLKVTLNLSVNNTVADAVTVYDYDAVTTYSYPYARAVGTTFGTTQNTESSDNYNMRINVARPSVILLEERTALVEYVGYFADSESAAAFNGYATERMGLAAELLSSGINIGYGDGASFEKACSGIKANIHNYGGSGIEIENSEYVSPTTEEKGSVYFDAVIKSAGEQQLLENCRVTIDKMPSEPIMIRFNDEETIKKLIVGDVSLSLVDGGYMKMEKLTPTKEDGFYFYVKTPRVVDNFMLQDYPYIKIKYKPMQISGTYQIYYTNPQDTYESDKKSISFNTPSWDKNVWLSAIIDTSKIKGAMELYNFETQTTTLVDSRNSAAPPYSGESDSFRFTFGRKQNQEKICYLEYIAFFPSMEMARNYNEEGEKYKSDGLVKLYKGDFTIPYYDGYTEDNAKEYIKNYAENLFNGAEINVNVISFTAPSDKKFGSIKYELQVSNEDLNIVFTTKELDNFIDAQVKTVANVWKFNSQRAINKFTALNGGETAVNGDGTMRVYNADEDGGLYYSATESLGVNTSIYPFVKIKYKAAENFDIKLVFNYSGGNLIAQKSGLKGTGYYTEAIFALSEKIVYQKNGYLYMSEALSVSGELGTFINGFSLEFLHTEQIDVDYIAFLNNLSQATDYDGYIGDNGEFDDINDFNFNTEYVKAKDYFEAVDFVNKNVTALLPTSVSLDELTVKTFTAATTEDQGHMTFTAVLRCGADLSSAYKTFNGSLIISKKPLNLAKEIVFTEPSEDVLFTSNVNKDTVSYDGGRLFVETDYALKEDGFGVQVKNLNIDLDVYKYIKIRYKIFGKTATESGRSLLFFYSSDDCSGSYKAYIEFSLGKYEVDGKELFLIIDVKKLEATLYNSQTNEIIAHDNISVSGSFSGEIKSLHFNFLRNITTERQMYLNYISFFTDVKDADVYNGDAIVEALELLGGAYLESAQSVSGVTELAAEIKIIEEITVESLIVGNLDNGLYLDAGGILTYRYKTYVLTATDSRIGLYKWYKIKAKVGDGKLQIFIDDKKVAEKATLEEADSEGKYYIGGFGSDNKNFIGYIKNVKLCGDNSEILAFWTLESKKDNAFANSVNKNNYAAFIDYYKYLSHEFMGMDYVYATKSLTEIPNTVELWVKPYRNQSEREPVLMNNENITVSLTENGNVKIRFGETIMTTTGLNLYNGKWTHLAVVRDAANSEVTLYRDGEFYQKWSGIDVHTDEKDKTQFTFGAATGSADGYVGGDKVTLYLNGSQKSGDILLENNSLKIMLDGGSIKMLFDGCFGYFGNVVLDTYNISDSYSFIGKQCYIRLISDVENQRVYLDVAETLADLDDHNVEDKGFAVNGKIFVDKRDGNVHTFEWTWKKGDSFGYLYSFDARKTDTSFVGEIGNVRVWSSIRSASQIAENVFDYYINGKAEETLIADWHFDRSNDLVYADYSSNESGAKIFSFFWFKTNMDQDEYKYAKAIFPDTQNNVLTDHYINDTMIEWVINNKEEYNFVTSMQVGDITQNATDLEWEWVYESYSKLDGVLPFTVAFGNHDFPALSGRGSGIRDAEKFNSLWDAEYYKTLYGEDNIGFFKEGEMQNIYVLYSDGENDFIQFAVEFAPRDEVIEWVGIMADIYSDRAAILTVHSCLNIFSTIQGTWSSRDTLSSDLAEYEDTTANEGIDIWEKVIKRHTNFIQVISGHNGANGDGLHYTIKQNAAGQDVAICLVDTSGEGGFPSTYGIFGIMEYNDDSSTVLYAFSPSKNAYYRTDAYYCFNTHTVNND